MSNFQNLGSKLKFRRKLVEIFDQFSRALLGCCGVKHLLWFLTNYWDRTNFEILSKFTVIFSQSWCRNFIEVWSSISINLLIYSDVEVLPKFDRKYPPIFVGITLKFTAIFDQSLTSQFRWNLLTIFYQYLTSLLCRDYVNIYQIWTNTIAFTLAPRRYGILTTNQIVAILKHWSTQGLFDKCSTYLNLSYVLKRAYDQSNFSTSYQFSWTYVKQFLNRTVKYL